MFNLGRMQVLGMVDKILRERADDIPLDIDRAVRPTLWLLSYDSALGRDARR